MAQKKCCTPEGQIKRYVDCIGCDRKPDDRKTAVDWLIEKLDNNLDINHSWRTRQYIEQAKQMEINELSLSFARGFMSGYAQANGVQSMDFEQYYKETYETDKL